MILGAGRNKVDDVIDPVVGLKVIKKVGDYVKAGDLLGIIYSDAAKKILYDSVINRNYDISKELINNQGEKL